MSKNISWPKYKQTKLLKYESTKILAPPLQFGLLLVAPLPLLGTHHQSCRCIDLETMIHLVTIVDLVRWPSFTWRPLVDLVTMRLSVFCAIPCTFATKPYHTIDNENYFSNLTLPSLLSVQVESVAGEVLPLGELHQARRVRASCHSAIEHWILLINWLIFINKQLKGEQLEHWA